MGRGWLILLLGITVFAAFGAVVGYAYFKGLPGIGGEPPLIKAQEGPYRHAPGDRGGLAVPNTNSSIVTRPAPAERAAAGRADPAGRDVAGARVRGAGRRHRADGRATRPAASRTQYPGGGCGGDRWTPSRSCCRDRLAISALQTGAARAGGAGRPSETTISALPQSSRRRLRWSPRRRPSPSRRRPPAPAPRTAQRRRAQPQRADRCAAPAPGAAAPATPAAGPQRLVRADPAAPAPPAPPRPASGAGIYRLQLAAVRSEGGLTQAWADLRQRYPAALGGGESAGRADRHHLRPPVPPAGRPVHLARGGRQRLRLDPRQRRPVLHRRADRPVRQA